MPDDKKIMVRVPKKINPEKTESKKGISDKETATETRPELAKAGLTSAKIKEIDDTTSINKKRNEVESLAKNDSISSANKAKLSGSSIYMQRKAGNEAANKVRTSSGAGNPLVQRFTNPHQYDEGDTHDGSKDTYIRNAPLEKEMPAIKKTMVKVKLKK